MREGNVFSLSTPGGWGGGVPQPSQDGGVPQPGGCPPQGTPLARSGSTRLGSPPVKVRMGGLPQPGGTHLGCPQPGQDGGGTPARGALTQGNPPPPRTGRHMEYLISGSRYASCIHAGGMSCFYVFSVNRCSVYVRIFYPLKGGERSKEQECLSVEGVPSA